MERVVPAIHGPDHAPGGPDPIPGFAPFEIEVYEPDRVVLDGDESFEFEIPEDLDGSTLVKVDGYLTTASSSGTVQVQLAKLPDGDDGSAVDLLTTKIFIEAGEVNCKESASQPVVDDTPGVAEFVWGDHVRVDVDNAGSGAKGLGVILYFTPSNSAAVVIQGAKGDPGGVHEWTGAYDGGATYVISDAVSSGGSSYVAIVDNPTTEPGVDPGWESEWMLLAEAQKTSSVDVIIDGNGYPLDIGVKDALRVPYDCELVEVMMLADVSGSVVIDIWKDVYANYAPTNADSITGSTPPTISSALKSIDTALTGWSTTLAEDDILAFNVDSCSAITRVTLSLKFLKT